MEKREIVKSKLLRTSDRIMVNARATMLYARHVKVLLPWSGLEAARREEIGRALDVIIEELRGRYSLFTAVKEKISEGSNNVF